MACAHPWRHPAGEVIAPRTSAAPRDRVPALLDALLRFKLDHRHLSLALEEAGSGSPFEGASYAWWHGVLRETLERLPDAVAGDADEGAAAGGADEHAVADDADAGTAAGPAGDCDFTAHALLAATRADLVEYLAGRDGMTPARMRARLAAYVGRVLGGGQAA